MKRHLLMLLAMVCCAVIGARADMFEPSPTPLQEGSRDVKIIFHADQSGVAALQNLNSDLYAHIGVHTTKSPSSWSHVVGDWTITAADKVKRTFKRVSANTFELSIGDIRSYFGITDASETVTQICVIARNEAGTVQTKDCFIDVLPAGFAMSLSNDAGQTAFMEAKTIKFTVNTTEAASIKLYVNNAEKKSATNATSLEYSQNFNTPGTYEVKAVATKGSETLTQTMNVLYISKAVAQNYPGGTPKQGAVKNSDGSVTFCLVAPGKSNVVICGAWDDYAPTADRVMKYQDYQGYRYFWTTVTGLDNSTYYPYYYLVDAKYKVSDPYAHLVLDCNSDKWLSDDVFGDRPRYPYDKFDDTMLAVYKGDLDNYNWKVNNFKVTNPKSLTIYELLVRDFTGTSNEADGTIRQAIEKIPYLKSLGVTAVELLPIMQFDGNNSWGYNTNNYMAPDKSYGSPDDYKEFIDKCHQAGIAVILDIVFNHTPGLHPWYQMYDEGTSPFYNANCPHDYGVYNDIKQEYPLWEQHWVDVLTYWLENYRVDGFRFDLVKGLGDSNSYGSGTEAMNQSRVNRMVRLHTAMKRVNPDVIHINENLASVQEETPMGNDGQLQWNNQNYNSINYARGAGSGDLKYLYSVNCSRPALSTVDYMESHDEPRLGYNQTKNGGNSNTVIRGNISKRMNRLGTAAAQMLLQPGPKMIWMFGEVGSDEDLPSNGRTDPKPVRWNYLENSNRKGLHDAYQALCWLRRDNPELFGSTSVTPVYGGFSSTVTGQRSIRLISGEKEVIGFFNGDDSNAKAVSVTGVSKLSASNYQVIAASKDFEPTLNSNGSTVSVTVPANSFCVLATKAVVGVDEILEDDFDNADSVKVIGGHGEIIIVGNYSNVEVYNIQGQQLGSLNVAPGIYVVNVDGNVSKVVVK